MGMTILVTGGAGFIGSALIRHLLESSRHGVVNLDKLTYAGNLESLATVSSLPRYYFERRDICDAKALRGVLAKHTPDAVCHLAAESHVDRSIDGPGDFMRTNVLGTFTLLEAVRGYWSGLSAKKRKAFRFLHVSTDEVYGSLGKEGYFTETTPYQPSSPYSASKAASDHFVRAWHHTYGLPILITNCSNNYGAYQFPEKLIPVIILSALRGRPIPVYGKGDNVRDWLYVEDHAAALATVLTSGSVGETYNVGGNQERSNLEVVRTVCSWLDRLSPREGGASYSSLIRFVPDRPGHDLRYAIDSRKIQGNLGWAPRENFESGIEKTVRWYLQNSGWCERALANKNGLQRLGTLPRKSATPNIRTKFK